MYLRVNNSKDPTDIQGNKFYISTVNLASCAGQYYRCTNVNKQHLGLLRPCGLCMRKVEKERWNN